MKTLEQQMAFYAAYHRNRWNKLTHFIGVPTIIFSILIPMGWARVAFGVEGRKPALRDNLFQIFVAPIFLLAEIFFVLGLKRDLRGRVQKTGFSR